MRDTKQRKFLNVKQKTKENRHEGSSHLVTPGQPQRSIPQARAAGPPKIPRDPSEASMRRKGHEKDRVAMNTKKKRYYKVDKKRNEDRDEKTTYLVIPSRRFRGRAPPATATS